MNPKKIHIAVDVMGGDFGPSVTIPAVLKALSDNVTLTITLLGDVSAIKKDYPALDAYRDRIHYVDCINQVTMDDKPSHALRHKQESSMFRAIAMVSRGETDACVSAGNTGALMAMGLFVLKTFPNINRPAVCAEMPTERGSCLMLDLGANVDCHAENFLQFAIMGSVMASAVKKISNPKVGLLNIGEEAGKGNEQVRKAAALLESNKQINYIGFVEGDDIYKGNADVVVCDGFVGNAVLKASEGVARLIGKKIRNSVSRSLWSNFLAFISKSVFRDIQNQINPSRYNGASILGLRGVVVVSHGKADIDGFVNALQLTCNQVEINLPQKIQSRLNQFVQ